MWLWQWIEILLFGKKFSLSIIVNIYNAVIQFRKRVCRFYTIGIPLPPCDTHTNNPTDMLSWSNFSFWGFLLSLPYSEGQMRKGESSSSLSVGAGCVVVALLWSATIIITSCQRQKQDKVVADVYSLQRRLWIGHVMFLFLSYQIIQSLFSPFFSRFTLVIYLTVRVGGLVVLVETVFCNYRSPGCSRRKYYIQLPFW